YIRITVSRLGILFLLLTFAHCFAHGGLQIALLRSDVNLRSLLMHITSAADVPSAQIPWLDHLGHGQYDLKLCTRIPLRGINTTNSCTSLFHTGGFSNAAAYDIDSVDTIYDDGSRMVLLSGTCSRTMLWAQNLVGSFGEEDVALLSAQFWLLLISSVAVSYRSIPQIVAVLCVRLIATMWSAYSIWRAMHYKVLFQLLYMGPGAPCQLDFFTSFFTIRTSLAIPSLILNITALAFEGYMGRKLIKAFDALIFHRVAPPGAVLKIYRYFLAIFVLLQLDVFFLLSMIGLWISWLINGLGDLTVNKTLYEALFITTMITLLPWLATGWFAVRREMKTLMAVFIFMSFVFLALLATMFRTDVFAWTFLQWPFFACLTCISFILLFATGLFGIICRLNFGKGLAQYLHVEAVLAEANFAPELFENDTRQLKISDEKSMHRPSTALPTEKYDKRGLPDDDASPVIVIERLA
ncbi:hypothetical protein WOLCODRAFT_73957, partial [Wolfiporia cocos MD-104 SS10]